MASQSRRPKNKGPNEELLKRLLGTGRVVSEPSSDELAAADFLVSKGIIHKDAKRFVKCSNLEDGDYPPRNPECSGEVELDDDLDEDGDELQCPQCNRTIYPVRNSKQVFQRLHIDLREDGIREYLESQLRAAGCSVASTDSKAVFTVEVGGLAATVHVMVVDFDRGSRFLERDFIRCHRSLVVVVDSEQLDHRLFKEEWIQTCHLASILVGGDLAVRVKAVSEMSLDVGLSNLTIPIVPKRHRPVVIDGSSKVVESVFLVELANRSMRVNGVQVLTSRGSTILSILEILQESFVECLRARKEAADFTSTSIEDIGDRISAALKQTKDIEVARESINRFQQYIVSKVHAELGTAIRTDSVIENAQGGYRFNPLHVAFRPVRPK